MDQEIYPVNGRDSLKRPKDVEAEVMELILPDDVKVEPDEKDVKSLIRRMEKTSKMLALQRSRDANGNYEAPTQTQDLHQEYGGKSVLIAIDYDSLSQVNNPNMEGSYRYPNVKNMSQTVKDPTSIPPIFLEHYDDTSGKRWITNDGRHRLYAARNNNPRYMPYLLAYVFADQLESLTQHNIVYKRVVDPTRR